MEKELKTYASPASEVVEMKMQGVLCDSVPVSIFSLTLLDDYGQDGVNTEGFVW